VNYLGLDCWTFFEISLGMSRMMAESPENWTPERLLHYIELDRYRGGTCTGEYLSRLHYLRSGWQTTIGAVWWKISRGAWAG
jgi:hypothetical protein